MMIVREIEAKSILNTSKIFDYCLNPYTGCQVSCRYCYARLFMKRYSGHREPWGEFVDAKINAPELLHKQLNKAKRGTVWLSSVCDPYQPVEARYELTRRCLHELVQKQFPVNIQTKSVLILRDIDLFRSFEEIEVGFTVTTDDERTAALFEPGASSLSQRFHALGTLHAAGIRTFAFIGPLLPGNPRSLVAGLRGKVDKVLIDRMNHTSSIQRFYRHLGMQAQLTDRFFNEYKEKLANELRNNDIAFEVLF